MNILITGEKSKIGLAFIKYMRERYWEKGYNITTISVRGESWKSTDFSKYDVVLHCAGIYNAPTQDYSYYEKINVQLTEELFQKSEADGVKQFIYISTMDVYNIQKNGHITKDTIPEPMSLYGKSKLEAENRIMALSKGKNIALSIIRCCPVIGSNAETKMEGYMKAFRFPFFPVMFTDDKRSILHIDALCELIKLIIDNMASGLYFPQNQEPLSVADILKIIKSANQKKTVLVRVPKFLWLNFPECRRVFGSAYYDLALSNHFNNEYAKMNSKEAIKSIFLCDRGLFNGADR